VRQVGYFQEFLTRCKVKKYKITELVSMKSLHALYNYRVTYPHQKCQLKCLRRSPDFFEPLVN